MTPDERGTKHIIKFIALINPHLPSDRSGFRAAKVEFEVFVIDDVNDGTNNSRSIPRDSVQQRLQPT